MLTKLDFGAPFSYCPSSFTEEGQKAKKIMSAIKNEKTVYLKLGKELKEIHGSQLVAKVLKLRKGLFEDFFCKSAALVPVPKSAPMKRGTLWPPFEIAKALQQEGFGTVAPVLKRVKKVPKSSAVPPHMRPKPKDHYESMEIEKYYLPSRKILLIDDVVTRGHTFMGAAWLLEEAFPEAEIKAFAAVRTVSNENEFRYFFDPVLGVIWYRPEHGDCLRREHRLI